MQHNKTMCGAHGLSMSGQGQGHSSRSNGFWM